jgi:NAD(P)H-hydrate repair Nnr-like enzyme with NAD(P)H-hydrate epimerase domain
MNDLGFPLEVLMELAGMSVAHAIYDLDKNFEKSKIKNILVIVGPGSNFTGVCL